jgi:hypothetical protein
MFAISSPQVIAEVSVKFWLGGVKFFGERAKGYAKNNL